jgi:hypothetical protein
MNLKQIDTTDLMRELQARLREVERQLAELRRQGRQCRPRTKGDNAGRDA